MQKNRAENFTTVEVDPVTGEHLGCDTKAVWTSGNKTSFSALLETFQEKGWLDKLSHGAHLVVTGGEPVIQQAGLVRFLRLLRQACKSPINIEMETNATLPMDPELIELIDQFNVSPKLRSSGELREKAYQFPVLQNKYVILRER